MSDMRKAIYEDTQEYEQLCKYYNEKPVCDKHGANPYCEHSKELQRRYYEVEKHSRW